jgi:hypothetical protein
VSKGAKQDRQKQQKHTCGVSEGAKQDRCMLLLFLVVLFNAFYSHHMYVIVDFGGTVYPLYSHHMYVIVVFGGTV